LPQRRSFDPGLRVRGLDVVRLGLDGTRWGVPLPWSGRLGSRGRAARLRVTETIDLVGASAYATRPIGELSGGEQQRLLVAQALVRRPRLLLLDEPLDSLDLPNQAAVAALISRISRDEGVTVVMVAHDVNPILAYLDSIVYLAGGRAATGAAPDVITGPTLTRLYRTPIEVLRASDGRLVVVGLPEAPASHSDRHALAHGHEHA
ncbi:MAG: ATP-binding cassette domain-containing protein, partial [Acidimicrobiales bacterium]